MVTVREHEFRATVAVDPPAREGAVLQILDGTRVRCIVQPFDGKCFPARISAGGPPPSPGRAVDIVVCIPLVSAEAEGYFAAGQPFTLWADAIVSDETIRGEGLLGDGVITGREPSVFADSPPFAQQLVPPATRSVKGRAGNQVFELLGSTGIPPASPACGDGGAGFPGAARWPVVPPS